MKNRILLLGLVIMIISIQSISAQIDLRVTATIGDVSSMFYTETDTTSNNGYDGNDVIAPGHFPSGNSSRFYSTVGSYQFAIDSWNLTNVPRTINLTLNTTPPQIGTLSLSWSFSDEDYDATLYYCGIDSTCASPSSSVDMSSSSSTTVTMNDGQIYFKIVISSSVVVVYCGDGICNNGETCSSCSGDCGTCSSGEPTCTPNCAGKTCGDNGCGGSCGSCSSGHSCSSGSCVLNCIAQTCSGLNKQCGNWDDGCGILLDCGTCSEGLNCDAGSCVIGCVAQTCLQLNKQCGSFSDGCEGSVDCGTCSEGFNCVSGVCELAAECANNGDCGEGQQCTDGSCQEIVVQCVPACSTGYNCLNGNCVEGEKPKKEDIPVNLVQIGGKNCQADFICSSWSKCQANYDVENLLSGVAIAGVRNRLCSDKNNCYSNFEESGECNLKEEIEVRTKNWCGQQYTEIVSKNTEKVIARIKTLPDGRAVSLNFNVGNSQGTCSYCFDGVMNYDETGIDCGGSCFSCTGSKIKRAGVFLVGTIYGYVLPLFMLFIFLSMLTYTLRFIFQYTIIVAENLLFRKYNHWKKEGYDVFVLDDDIKKIKRRL